MLEFGRSRVVRVFDVDSFEFCSMHLLYLSQRVRVEKGSEILGLLCCKEQG